MESDNINTHDIIDTNNIEQTVHEDFMKDRQVQDYVTEGKATVRLSNEDKSFSAFYNPAQEFNRDLSVAAINTFFTFDKFRKEKEKTKILEEKFAICECLSATGLRAIRYSLELDKTYVKEIVANDMDKKAVDCILNNVEKNQIDRTKFRTYQEEATKLLYSNLKMFEIIDLDPYGSAIPMIDSAIQSIKPGGLLCVTFTDMSVLCGNYPETAFYKYGAIPYKTSFCHEMAKRIAMYSISTAASKYKKVIKPLLSFNAEFYIRLFMVVKDSPEDCKNNALKYGYLFHCRNCQNRRVQPLATLHDSKNAKTGKVTTSFRFNNLTGENTCEICDSLMCMSGPYWIDPLHDEDFIDKVVTNLESETFSYLKYGKRLITFIKGIKEEFPLNSQVFSLDYAQFARDVQVSCPKLSLVKGAFESLGYKMVQSYYDPNLFKTDAPVSVVYDIFKKYKKDNYNEDYLKNVKAECYKYKILSKAINSDPLFVESKEESTKCKYPPHPFPNWGPKTRAKEKKQKDNKP